MAQRVLVLLTDDLDGESEADETVPFALDGVEYEIDLTGEHAEELRSALQHYVASARRTGGRSIKRRTAVAASPARVPAASNGAGATTNGASPYDPKLVRAWAAENGVQVNARGRLASDIIDRYAAAIG